MSQNPPLSQGDLTKLLWIRTFCTKIYFLLLLCCSLLTMNSNPLVLTKSYVICSLLISSKHDLTGTSNPVVMVLYHCFRKFQLPAEKEWQIQYAIKVQLPKKRALRTPLHSFDSKSWSPGFKQIFAVLSSQCLLHHFDDASQLWAAAVMLPFQIQFSHFKPFFGWSFSFSS